MKKNFKNEDKFGGYTILNDNLVNCKYHCKCKCGKEQYLTVEALKQNKHGCVKCSAIYRGKQQEKELPKIGDKFGKLTIIDENYKIKFSGKQKAKRVYVNTKCECGKEKYVLVASLRRNVKGCLKCSQKLDNKVNNTNRVYSEYKFKCKKRNMVFALSKEDVKNLIYKNCEYCGSKPSNLKIRDGEKIYYNGIDRVDNSIGYTKKNCVTCCKICNIFKNNNSLDSFKEHIKKLYNKLFTLE